MTFAYAYCFVYSTQQQEDRLPFDYCNSINANRMRGGAHAMRGNIETAKQTTSRRDEEAVELERGRETLTASN